MIEQSNLYWSSLPFDAPSRRQPRERRMLTRTSTQSLTGQLADRLAERIRTRLLPPGARLPSVRECARQQGVSPYTVVAAYDQLLAQGLVEARRQRGFYVRDSAPRTTAEQRCGPAASAACRPRWPCR
jgi:DNA-binding transcriptional regulator YhcF (GntR family)